jgi:membrane fusion protein (multidrug efflux system)
MYKNFVKVLLIVLLLISFLNLSCGNSDAKSEVDAKSDSTNIAQRDSGEKKLGQEDTDKSKESEELIPVEVTTIKRGTISDYILLSSNLETEKMADVYSRIQGLVQKIYVNEGDFVKKGQILMTLEADEYKLAEERAQLSYLKQESDFERMKAMFNKDLLSKEEFEQARYATQGLEVEWKEAKLNLSYTKITAPISGVIGDRLRKPGERIQPVDKLFTVINTDEMIAVVYAPEKELGRVEKSQTAYITSDNIPGERFTASVKRVSPVVDPQSGTFKVTIGVRNKKNKLRVGMFINTHIVTATHQDAILIPKTAIVYENELMNVFVVKDSVAHKINLKVGFQDHEKVEVLADIEEGDKVIVVGQAGLKDQTKVRIVSERENLLAMRRQDALSSIN